MNEPVLILRTENYMLKVYTKNLQERYRIASSRIDRFPDCTNYNYESAYNYNKNESVELKIKGKVCEEPYMDLHPVFFDNSEYLIDIEFEGNLEDVSISLNKRSITNNFIYRSKLITGSVNFGNNIGRSYLSISYNKKQEHYRDKFEFCVLSSKLDIDKDLFRILSDINREYETLIFDFLRETYIGLHGGGGKSKNLIWWKLFEEVYNRMRVSVEKILSKPHSRLISETRYCKAEQVKRFSRKQEEKFANHRFDESQLYKIDTKKNTIDTTENRFLKYAIINIYFKFSKITSIVNQESTQSIISPEYLKDILKIEKELLSIKNLRLFRRIGKFQGFHQVSKVIQQSSGYNDFFCCWKYLQKAIDLVTGQAEFSMKEISELYEIWCFLELKNIIERYPNVEKVSYHFHDLEKSEGNKLITNFKSGKKAKIEFRVNKKDKLLLFHEYEYDNIEDSEKYRSYTIKQRPDITMRLIKNDLIDNTELTYLFDAKYRLGNNSDEYFDQPPNDAINQMHRYRDAIYYSIPTDKRKFKEVIGGFILFPGRATNSDVINAGYYKSIKNVNIGAIPLLPSFNAKAGNRVIDNFIEELLDYNTILHLSNISPQRHMKYEEINEQVVIGKHKNRYQRDYLLNEKRPVYHLPIMRMKNKLEVVNSKWFALYESGIGVKYVFPIKKYKILHRNEIFEIGHKLYSNNTDLYIVLFLGRRYELDEPISSTTLSFNKPIIYSNLFRLKNWENNYQENGL